MLWKKQPGFVLSMVIANLIIKVTDIQLTKLFFLLNKKIKQKIFN